MENTTVDLLAGSNSESDISDSWAVIDDDSSLEWNNVMSLNLRPPQYDFVESRIPRASISKGELSDEDSIEVVPEDHDDISEKEPEDEIVQDEEWTGTDQLERRETILTETCRPTPDQSHLKWRESNPILITILIMGIVGLVLGFGYLWPWASHSEDSSYIQPTRALLTKLENEIQFLRRQLRSAQSSLKSAVNKTVPKLQHVTKQDLHTNTKGKLFKDNHPGMCSVTDVLLKSHILQDNVTKEYCLASDRPQANENVWTHRFGNMSGNIAHTSSSSNASATKNHLKVNTGVINNNNELLNNKSTTQYIPNDVKQINQAFQESRSFSGSLDSLQHANTRSEAMHSSDVIARNPSGISAGNEKIMSGSDGRSDPRPYTKLRTTMDRIYTILSVIHNGNQTDFPSQLELLSILPHNIVALNRKGHFTTNVHDKISSFTVQMQDTTQKLLADIESSINSFVQHIALKVKEIETVNKKQICNLKTSLESSVDPVVLDFNREPIFLKCIQEDIKNYHDDLLTNGNKHEVKDQLSVSKELFSESCTSGENEPSEQPWRVNGKDYFYREHNKHKNVQQNLNSEFGETNSVFVDKKDISMPSSDLNEKCPKIKEIVLENVNHLKESTGRPMEQESGTCPKRKSENDLSDQEIKPKIVKTAKNNKSGTKCSNLRVNKTCKKSSVKKKFGKKENKDFGESHAKGKKYIKKSSKVVNTNKTSTNVSGEWAMKMAHGRAEQRHRGHQSDWVFERAKARMSNRKKNIKESYWRNDRDYCNTIMNCNVYNNTMPFKDQTSKSWKEVKLRMKKNVWKPLIDSAKSVKKAFYKFNNKIRHHHYHSRQE